MEWKPSTISGFSNLLLGVTGGCPDADWCSGHFPPSPTGPYPFQVNFSNGEDPLSKSLLSPQEPQGVWVWVVEVAHAGELEEITFTWDHQKLSQQLSDIYHLHIIDDPNTQIDMINPPGDEPRYQIAMGKDIETFLICGRADGVDLDRCRG